MRRVDTQYVEIGRDIYEVRRDNYVRRVEAMVGYITETDLCRSRYLLHYFDDEATDCGHCDVCCEGRSVGTAETGGAVAPPPSADTPHTDADRLALTLAHTQHADDLCRALRDILADGKPHALDGLFPATMSRALQDAVLDRLIDEGTVTLSGLTVTLAE